MRPGLKYYVWLTTAPIITDKLTDDLRDFVIRLGGGDDFSETMRGNP